VSLAVALERELPSRLPAGRRTVVFVVGTCWATGHRLTGLEVLVDGVAQPTSAFGAPRPDLTEAPPERRRGGFWATVVVTAPPAGAGARAIALTLRAHCDDGSELSARLGTIAVAEPVHGTATPAGPEPAAARIGPDTIAVCMATYEPDPTLLGVQIRSLQDQTDQDWICLISDDCSSAQRRAEITALVAGDSRFRVESSPQRLGFYRNFERALGMVPPQAGLVALCDQDDRWHPDKLATLRAALGEAVLVYSDQRLVDAEGRVLRGTLWRGRTNNFSSLTSMLVANTITGASMLMRARLLELALPFPDTPGFQFHDAWLAVIALSCGDIAYVDRPLYDYVQHPGAVFGDVTHGATRAPSTRLWAWARAVRDAATATSWRAAYFHGYLGRRAQAQLSLSRGGATLRPDKRRVLERFVALDGSPAGLIWLTLRALRQLTGRTETLGSEWGLAQGLAWKAALTAAARHPRLTVGPLRDASIPPPGHFSQRRLRRWRARL
jgi:glycosyltransferase involved in cell wall biosynthesis